MNIHKHARQETGRLLRLAGRMEAAWPATLTVPGARWPECLWLAQHVPIFTQSSALATFPLTSLPKGRNTGKLFDHMPPIPSALD